jgi:hypothetical protein
MANIRTDLQLGDRWEATMPFSEVCMHMRVAGTKMICAFAGNPDYPMVQLYKTDGIAFSSPVTTGEAGVYGDARCGFYTYGEKKFMTRYRVANNSWNRANCRPEIIGKVFINPPSYCAVTVINGLERYAEIVAWARKRYQDSFRILVLSVGDQPSKYSQIEKSAWNKYVNSLESSRCL